MGGAQDGCRVPSPGLRAPVSSSSLKSAKQPPPTASYATTASLPSPAGGDVLNAWSADDLDRLLGKRLAVPAASFYDLRNGVVDGASLASKLLATLPCCFIIHVRFHWVAAQLKATAGVIALTIYDSAPSPPVRRDVRRMASALRLPEPLFAPCPRQARGTSECGVFAALFILILSSGRTPPSTTGTVSLAELRFIPDVKRFYERGCELLGMPHRANQPYTPLAAPSITAGAHDVYTVEDSPNLTEDLFNLQQREALVRQALVPHTALPTEIVDSLISEARSRPGSAAIHIYAAPAATLRSAMLFPFIKPLIYSGHFSLLFMRNASFGEIFDTLPRHCPGVRTATIDTFLRSGGVDTSQRHLRLEVIGPQETNDCGLWVVNQALRLLQLPSWDPQCGLTLRDWLLRPMLRELSQAIAALSPTHQQPLADATPIPSTAATQAEDSYVPASIAPDSFVPATFAPVESFVPETPSLPAEATHEDLLAILRTAKPGQRISASWWERQFPDDIVTWTGTVSQEYNAAVGSIMVQWDPGMRLFIGNHRRPRSYPEFGFPDPRFALVLPTLSGFPTPHVVQHSGPSLDELRSALQTDPVDFDSDCSDTDSEADDETGTAMLSRNIEPHGEDPYAAERMPIMLPLVTAERICARKARSWFIFDGRPRHIPPMAWNQLSPATRRAHVRWLRALKSADPRWYDTPLPTAVIELVLQRARQAGWKWSTISSNLSLACSALAKLPLYTNCVQGIDIGSDPVFSAAVRRSSQLARITVQQNTRLTAPMSVRTYEKILASIANPDDRLFFELSWVLAARIGDARQLTGENITFDDAQATDATIPATFRFVSGKTTQAHGPYTIRVLLSRTLAQRLAQLIHRTKSGSTLWTAAHQDRLRQAVKIHRLTLRSVRKGSLQHQASLGVSDEALRLLSGHRRMETLQRYLGWGHHSADAAKAARERYEASAVRGGSLTTPARPPLMGLHSGEIGPAGRRVAPQPPYIPLRPPAHSELGLGGRPDTTDWPLHVKPGLQTLSWNAIMRIAPTSCHPMLDQARRWVSDPALYGTPKTSYASTRLSEAQLQILIDAGKLDPIPRCEAKAYCSGWLLPQERKRRLRPIFEPSINRTLLSGELLAQAYPSRLERRQQMVGAETFVELDFAAFFDQIELSPDVRPYFTVMSRGSCYALTRLPMGASFAPGVAQAITWSLVAATQRQHPDVQFATMIDNVRISGDRTSVAAAARLFIRLCQEARITLNEVDIDAQLCADSGVFLGELYSKGSQRGQWFISNSERTVEKIRAATALWRQQPVPAALTRRNFAAYAGLLLFAAHTINVPLADHFELLRGYSAIVAGCPPVDSGATARGFWDQPLPFLEPSLQSHLMALADVLIANRPVPITAQAKTPHDETYDTIVYIDASQNAWAAIVVDNVNSPRSTTSLLQQRWRDTLRFSAWAEPRAVHRCLRHLSLREKPPRRIAVVTDHIAIVSGQSRWTSRFAGFSASWFLNSAYKAAAAFDRVEFFYIKGAENPADAASREVSAGFDLIEKRIDPLALPALATLYHPLADAPTHPFEHQRTDATGRHRRTQWGTEQNLQDGDFRHFIKKQITNSRLCFEHQMRAD